MRVHGGTLPLADSFLVLMIFAAYSCPDDFLTHLRTTEKAPLRKKEHKQAQKKPQKISSISDLSHQHAVTFETAPTSVTVVLVCVR